MDSSRDLELEIPKRIGKYRIIRQLAQGGMAEIFLASASGIEGFEKLCVLKRILPLLAGNREFVAMFLDEARIAASLLHSNIAQVFDIGSEAGSYYFVMELLRGEDVRHILRAASTEKASIPLEHISTILTGVCAGLHHAHEMKDAEGKPLAIVHRDISPQNIFVTHDGNVKLCDFGIAKSAARLTETRVGTLKGKVRYMSPEQCQSHPLDRRSDIFSLCVVLWELVTMRRLFSGAGDFEICKAIIETDAPLASIFRPDLPPALDAILKKGLSRAREDRFQTAQELQLAIESWTRDDRVPASPVHLSTYMRGLFGEPRNELFVEKSEQAALAARIRAQNQGDASSSDVVTPSPSLEAKTPVLGTPAVDRFSDRTEAGRKSGGSSLLDEPFFAEEPSASLEVPRRSALRPLALGALIASLAAGTWLAMRSRPAPAPAPLAASVAPLGTAPLVAAPVIAPPGVVAPARAPPGASAPDPAASVPKKRKKRAGASDDANAIKDPF